MTEAGTIPRNESWPRTILINANNCQSISVECIVSHGLELASQPVNDNSRESIDSEKVLS